MYYNPSRALVNRETFFREKHEKSMKKPPDPLEKGWAADAILKFS